MIRAKKSLGQNFLKSKKVLKKIVEVSNLKKSDLVLEVGPGKGALTAELLKTEAKVLALEKDHRMIGLLKDKFSKEIEKGQIKIIEGDALEINYQELYLKNGHFKIVANLPYYITGKFLSNILSAKRQPELLVLMLQKAVVERIVLPKSAGKKEQKNFKENLLSLSVKVYGEPEFIMPVSASNFSPRPKVDSAVLKVSEISKKFFEDNKIDEKEFFNFLKAAFSSKRKKIIKNLVDKKIFSKEELENIFNELSLDLNSRAEDLALSDFKKIFLKRGPVK